MRAIVRREPNSPVGLRANSHEPSGESDDLTNLHITAIMHVVHPHVTDAFVIAIRGVIDR